MKATKKNHYQVEIYLRNPETLEMGWDIEIENVYANNREEAAKLIKAKHGILFDCFIEQSFEKFN